MTMTSSRCGPRDRSTEPPERAASQRAVDASQIRAQRWGLISNHGAALGVLARDPNVTVRDLAQSIGVTERSATNILRDLRDGGFVNVRRVGRRNLYSVNLEQKLRRAGYRESTVGELLAALHAMVDIDEVERHAGDPRYGSRTTPPSTDSVE
ncbi:MAG: helix-turn-helix domain-containing protein [Chloroflexi bacterium]|nr:helix-turn-helix domain-containing protein [Chloroflexota bacterium]